MTEESTPVQTSNAEIQSEEKKMETYLVAYLDFLGASERMKKDNQELLTGITQMYNTVKNFIPEDELFFSNVKVKIFSDNILIAKKLEDYWDFVEYHSDCIYGMLRIVSMMLVTAQTSLHLMMRGGITIGKLYIDSDFVWGPALVRAHYLESSVANYPRVVIDSVVRDFGDLTLSTTRLLKTFGLPVEEHLFEKAERFKKSDYYKISLALKENLESLFLQDSDGVYYLDYLGQDISSCKYSKCESADVRLIFDRIGGTVYPLRDTLKMLRNFLTSDDNKTDDVHVYQKVSWAISYFNSVCIRHNLPEYCIQKNEYPGFPGLSLSDVGVTE